MACLSLLIKNKVLVFTEFTCEPHRHYQTGQSMASPNPSDHLITFTVQNIFSLYLKSVLSSLLNQGQVCLINISMSHKSKNNLYKKAIHLLSSSTISCKPLQNHCSVIFSRAFPIKYIYNLKPIISMTVCKIDCTYCFFPPSKIWIILRCPYSLCKFN